MEVIRYVTKEIPWFNWASTNKLVCFKPKDNLRVPKNWDLKSPNIRDLDTAKERVSKINKFSNTTQELDLTSYPLELKYAIEAWLAVSKIDEKGKPKARIKKWLNDNTSLSNEAKNRISIVANWDKSGGATKT